MLIVNRYYRENGVLQHSTEFFENAVITDGDIPEDVKINMLKKIAADVQREKVDYAMCQIIDSNGNQYKTEVGIKYPESV